MPPDTKPVFRTFQPVTGVALQHQITQFLRQLIVRGELAPEERLPNLRVLAQLWGTSHYTVEAGITPLVVERLVLRRPRLGTFVARPRMALQHVGIYCDHVPAAGIQDVFVNAVTTALFQALATAGVHLQAWFDTRPEAQRREPLPALVKAVAERQVHAIAATAVNSRCLPWLLRLGIPCATVSARHDHGSVSVDDTRLASLAVERLAARGCRRVGLLSHSALVNPTPAAPYGEVPLYGDFWRAAQAAGCVVEPAWLITPLTAPKTLEECGYRLFKRWWLAGHRCDGLFIYPDTVARGAFHAMQELRVAVPGDLRLVVHRNEEVEFFTPLPVDWVTVSVRAMAQGLITQLQRQVKGEPAPPMLIPPMPGRAPDQP